MKIIKRSLMIFFMLTVMTILYSTTAKAATPKPYLDHKSMTLYVGEGASWNCLQSTSGRGISWSISNKKVASIKKEGVAVYVTPRKTGSAVLKAKYKGKTYSCKIKVVDLRKKAVPKIERLSLSGYQWKDEYGDTDSYGDGDDCLVARVKNSNKMLVDISMKVTFYDSLGVALDTSSDWADDVPANGTTYLKMYIPSEAKNYHHYKTTYEVTRSNQSTEQKTVSYNKKITLTKIKTSKTQGSWTDYKYLVENKSRKNLDTIELMLLCYDKRNKLVYVDSCYADNAREKGGKTYVTVSVPKYAAASFKLVVTRASRTTY